MSAFADREIIHMARDEFVPVTADDWYQRRRQDAEGEFFRKVADQGPRKGQGGSTRQGVYVLTADGELLSYKNAGQNAEVTRDELKRALAKFNRLPANRRLPQAVTVGNPGRPDPNFTRTPPAGGLVVRVHTRILDRTEGGFCKGACQTTGGDAAARDFLWLTRDEAQSLIKKEPGAYYDLPKPVADRVIRFHLVDNTRGEPPFWKTEDVRRSKLTLRVVRATPDAIELQLNGDVLLATDADPTKSNRGYEAKLRGELRYIPAKQTFDRFDVVAIGEHWGEGTYTRGARTGRSLLGVAFGPVAGDRPADRVPPQAAREIGAYLGKY